MKSTRKISSAGKFSRTIVWETDEYIFHREEGPAVIYEFFRLKTNIKYWYFFGRCVAHHISSNEEIIYFNHYRGNISDKEEWFKTLNFDEKEIVIWNPGLFNV